MSESPFSPHPGPEPSASPLASAPAARAPRKSKLPLTALKAAITLGALALIFRKVDFQAILPILARCRWGYLGLFLASHLAMSFFLAQRWRVLWDTRLPLRKYLYFVFLGNYFNLIMPSTAVSEAIRVLAFGRKYGNMQENIGVNLFARGLGFILQLVTGAAALFLFREELASHRFFERMQVDWRWPLALVPVLLLAAALAYRFRRAILRQRWIGIMAEMAGKGPLLVKASIYTLLIQAAAAAAIYTAFASLDAGAKLWEVLIFPPITQLVLMLPISFGGVGVREYLTLFFFSDIGGIRSDVTFATSMLAYLGPILLAIMGGLWMAFRRYADAKA